MHTWVLHGGWLQLILVALLIFLINPLHYIATGLVIWDLVRNIRSERTWFGVRVTRIIQPLIFRYLKACIVGAIGSIGLLLAGAHVSWQSIAIITVLSLVLGAIRTRFAATPFVIAATVTLSWIARAFPSPSSVGFLSAVVRALQNFEVESWLLIGVAATLSELFMQWWNARDAVFPALVTSKRGRRIGALQIQLGFSVPMVVWLTPLHHTFIDFSSGFKPWLVSASLSLGLAIIPTVFGIHAMFTALRPERVLVQWRWWNVVEAVILGAGFSIYHFTHVTYAFIAAPLAIVVMEVGRSLWIRVDSTTEPLCAPDSRGVTVLYTIRGSLSERLGLKPGEVVTHVNQTPVHTEFDLHFAFDQNPAYAKFQVIDTRGEVRIVGNPVYEGERHQLGLLVAVPGTVLGLNLKHSFGFLETLYLNKQIQKIEER